MNSRILIIGASGHGKVVADIAKKNGYEEILFLDDNEMNEKCGCYPVIGKTCLAKDVECDLFVAIGNADVRKKFMERYSDKKYPILIHPNAIVADDVEIGEGTVVMAGAVLNPNCKIGKGSIINTCASVDHDCIIGEYVHVSVGAHVAGTVTVGNRTWVCAGATVSNDLTIECDCVVGAGAVVINDLLEPGTYVGVPARKIKSPK